jgi:hypothetical protein
MLRVHRKSSGMCKYLEKQRLDFYADPRLRGRQSPTPMSRDR